MVFCCISQCFVAKSFFASYAVLSRNLFLYDLRASAWRKIEPKIVPVEKKWQIWGMQYCSIFLHLSPSLSVAEFCPTSAAPVRITDRLSGNTLERNQNICFVAAHRETHLEAHWRSTPRSTPRNTLRNTPSNTPRNTLRNTLEKHTGEKRDGGKTQQCRDFLEYFRTNWVWTAAVATVSYIQWFVAKWDHTAHISVPHSTHITNNTTQHTAQMRPHSTHISLPQHVARGHSHHQTRIIS